MEMRSKRIALDKLYKRRDRYEIPDWQRSEVWSSDQEKLLIDSILRGWKLPKFYLLVTGRDPDTFEVVDGQQRLSAIWGFFDGDVEIEVGPNWGGPTYEKLMDVISDRFDDYEIEYDEISDADEEDVKKFFQRLQAGLPLTSSEKLNAEHSKLRDYCVKLAEHPVFGGSTTIANRRHAYFDICAKVMTLEIEGYDAGLRYEDVRAVFRANKTFSPSSAVAKRVKTTLDFIQKVFPSKSSALKQRSILQSIITLASHLRAAGMTDDQAPAFRAFVENFLSELVRQVELGSGATDSDYLAFQRTVNANAKGGAGQRHTILLRKLFKARPDFFSELSKGKVLDAGLEADIASLAGNIQTFVAKINDDYAGTHGHDLFKQTNRTVPALVALGQPVRGLEEYKKWVDNLYFVFRESIGQRLDNVPQSFVAVNDLRTFLDHDVDHGKGAAAKRKKLAATFKRFAGDGTPQTLAPEKFVIVQSNLLDALLNDLQLLEKSLPVKIDS